MENPIKIDDLGVPLFSETPIYEFIVMFFGDHHIPGSLDDLGKAKHDPICSSNLRLGAGFQYVLFSPLPGEMIQFDYMIFFKWVETTNQTWLLP